MRRARVLAVIVALVERYGELIAGAPDLATLNEIEARLFSRKHGIFPLFFAALWGPRA